MHVLEPELTATDRYAALAEAVAQSHEEAASVQASAIVRIGSEALEEVLNALDAAGGPMNDTAHKSKPNR